MKRPQRENATSWLGLAAGLITAFFSTFAYSGVIDLGKPINVAPGRGVAVFSFTLSNSLEKSTTLLWRSVGAEGETAEKGEVSFNAGGLFANEELAGTSHLKWGRLVGLDLPPGTYEFYQFRSVGQSSWQSAKEDFSRKFVVDAGKINYVGNIDILTGQGEFGGGRFLLSLLTGVFTNAFDTYPSLIDRSAIDLPLLAAKGLPINTITPRVTLDEADSTMLEQANALRVKADAGDPGARFNWLLALINGWAVLPDQSRIKVFDGRNTWSDYAEQLAAQGVPGAETYLGMRYDATLHKAGYIKLVFENDDPRLALRHYLADAEYYQENALQGIKRLLEKNSDLMPDSAQQLSHIKKRLDGVRELSAESLPYGNERTRNAMQRYLKLGTPKYFALSVSGAYGLSQGDKGSIKAALAACQTANKEEATSPCTLYAIFGRKLANACKAEMAKDKVMKAPPLTGLGDVSAIDKLPAVLDETARRAYSDFLLKVYPRAFAISDQGAYGTAAGDCQAAYRALLACTRENRGNCRLWTIDDQIVSGTTDAAFIEAEQRLLGVAAREGWRGEFSSSEVGLR